MSFIWSSLLYFLLLVPLLLWLYFRLQRQRRNLAARLRSLDMCDSPLQHCGLQRDFGWALMQGRKSIERSFSQLHFDGLYAPPPHVRHPRRMALWVACKIMIRLVKQAAKN